MTLLQGELVDDEDTHGGPGGSGGRQATTAFPAGTPTAAAPMTTAARDGRRHEPF